MNFRIIRAIALKDWRQVRQNRMALMAMLVLPIIFSIGLPLLFIALPKLVPDSSATSTGDIEVLMKTVPQAVRDQLSQFSHQDAITVLMLGYLFAPMFLMMPLLTSSIIGADSFAGEKERKTMEGLLYTPATERELFFGKMLAAFIPALLITWGSFLAYAIILNVGIRGVAGDFWFPTPSWWPLIFWVTPAIAIAGNLAAVAISARVNTFMSAYQASSSLVLPLVILMVGQIGGLLFLGVEVMLILGIIVWIVDIGLLWLGLKLFSRARLMGAAAQNQG